MPAHSPSETRRKRPHCRSTGIQSGGKHLLPCPLCADEWHRRFFNRYVPLFGVITLSLVAIALCLSYWCQDRNSPETESSRAHLEELRRMQCGERVAMYTMPPSTDTYSQRGCPGHDFYGYPPPPPRYNYATFDPRVPPTGPLQPSAPPAYQSR
ncbi:uncharacterized protein [Dermacentor albipictus]|uniref:uncharacterized protein isoform X2 n=1 Tax=Dermacentor albipictus TaxID=60249 RepID=UPI0038FCC868